MMHTYPAARLASVFKKAMFYILCHRMMPIGKNMHLNEIVYLIFYLCLFRWQARKEFDKTTRAGLIPSRALQERRIMHERSQMAREMSTSESKSELNLLDFYLFLKSSYFSNILTNFCYFLLHSHT